MITNTSNATIRSILLAKQQQEQHRNQIAQSLPSSSYLSSRYSSPSSSSPSSNQYSMGNSYASSSSSSSPFGRQTQPQQQHQQQQHQHQQISDPVLTQLVLNSSNASNSQTSPVPISVSGSGSQQSVGYQPNVGYYVTHNSAGFSNRYSNRGFLSSLISPIRFDLWETWEKNIFFLNDIVTAPLTLTLSGEL